jgi:hypothetical protein
VVIHRPISVAQHIIDRRGPFRALLMSQVLICMLISVAQEIIDRGRFPGLLMGSFRALLIGSKDIICRPMSGAQDIIYRRGPFRALLMGSVFLPVPPCMIPRVRLIVSPGVRW